MNLSEIEGVVLDMDGVLWRGNSPLPGLAEFFSFLRHQNILFVLATNNSRRSPREYTGKMESLSVPDVEISQVITSGTATVDYLLARFPLGTRMFVIGGDGLREILVEAGFVLAVTDAEIVVVGIDFDLSYEKLRLATLFIRSGALFVGTNPDVTFPTPEGLAPGAGSILALLEAATDIKPTVIGKPEGAMFETALHVLKTPPEKTLMIGDRLGTDILGGINAGLKTALVMTGVTTPKLLAESTIQPDIVFDGLDHLLRSWSEIVK